MTLTPRLQLAPVLRSLRLTGMLETLDARLAEARAGTLGHVEFLQVLCEDELARRDATAVSRRLRAAHLPTAATLEGFDFSYNPKFPQPRSVTWPAWSSSPPAKGFAFTAPSGWARATSPPPWPTRPAGAAMTPCSSPPAACSPSFAGGHADRSFAAWLKRLAKPAVLVVDLSRGRDYPDVRWA